MRKEVAVISRRADKFGERRHGAACRIHLIDGASDVVAWLVGSAALDLPRQADPDKLDAVICLLIAARRRLGEAAASAMIGDLVNGYIVMPTSPAVRRRLAATAETRGVPFSR